MQEKDVGRSNSEDEINDTSEGVSPLTSHNLPNHPSSRESLESWGLNRLASAVASSGFKASIIQELAPRIFEELASRLESLTDYSTSELRALYEEFAARDDGRFAIRWGHLFSQAEGLSGFQFKWTENIKLGLTSAESLKSRLSSGLKEIASELREDSSIVPGTRCGYSDLVAIFLMKQDELPSGSAN